MGDADSFKDEDVNDEKYEFNSDDWYHWKLNLKERKMNPMKQIGHRLVGSGKEKVLVMHNWFGDSTSYDSVLPYLDIETFTYAFVDWRGYGLSKSLPGECTVEEATRDALSLVDYLSWKRFHLIGHSMSGMIAQKITSECPARIASLIAITPVPASGSPKPKEVMSFMEGAAQGNDENAVQAVHLITGQRYSDVFARKMVQTWRACSTPEARLKYLHMFSDTDFSTSVRGLKTPMLVIYGAHDFEGWDKLLQDTFLAWYPNAHMVCAEASGHFPTQETPVYLATLIDKFLRQHR